MCGGQFISRTSTYTIARVSAVLTAVQQAHLLLSWYATDTIRSPFKSLKLLPQGRPLGIRESEFDIDLPQDSTISNDLQISVIIVSCAFFLSIH